LAYRALRELVNDIVSGGIASFRQGLDQFARIMKSIDVIRLVVDGEHCVAILNIDTVFGPVPFAEHIRVAN
jgi:hypothetical protein